MLQKHSFSGHSGRHIRSSVTTIWFLFLIIYSFLKPYHNRKFITFILKPVMNCFIFERCCHTIYFLTWSKARPHPSTELPWTSTHNCSGHINIPVSTGLFYFLYHWQIFKQNLLSSYAMWLTFVLRKSTTKCNNQLKIKWMKGTTMIVAVVLYNFKLFYLNSVISNKIPAII